MPPPPLLPAAARRLVLVVGRNDARRPSAAFEAVVRELQALGLPVLWHESRARRTSRRLEALFERLAPPALAAACDPRTRRGKRLRSLARALILLGLPWRWDYALAKRLDGAHASPPALAKFLRGLRGTRVTLLTHSAGGIAAAQVEAEAAVEGHICFGYPFRHPDRADEPHRTQALAGVRKPFLIVQGDADAYGNGEQARRYALSPAIRLLPVRATHDYDGLTPQEFEALMAQVRAFLGLGPAAAAVSGPRGGQR